MDTLPRLKGDRAALERYIPLGPIYMFLDSDWKNFVKVEGVWLEQGTEPDAKPQCFRLWWSASNPQACAHSRLWVRRDRSTSAWSGMTFKDGTNTKLLPNPRICLADGTPST